MTERMLYGRSTQEARKHFPVLCARLHPALIRALGIVKYACIKEGRSAGEPGESSQNAGSIEEHEACVVASAEVAQGKWDDQFPLDLYQSDFDRLVDANVSEVIYNRAVEILGGNPGGAASGPAGLSAEILGRGEIDTFGIAVQVTAALALANNLIPGLRKCSTHLRQKVADVAEPGDPDAGERTAPGTGFAELEFLDAARQFDAAVQIAGQVLEMMAELTLNSSDRVSTGGFGERVIGRLAQETNLPFRKASMGARRPPLVRSHALLTEIAWVLLAIGRSAARCDLFHAQALPLEAQARVVEPGQRGGLSDSFVLTAMHLIGNDQAIAMSSLIAGQIEPGGMLPLFGHKTIESIMLLNNIAQAFIERCV